MRSSAQRRLTAVGPRRAEQLHRPLERGVARRRPAAPAPRRRPRSRRSAARRAPPWRGSHRRPLGGRSRTHVEIDAAAASGRSPPTRPAVVASQIVRYSWPLDLMADRPPQPRRSTRPATALELRHELRIARFRRGDQRRVERAVRTDGHGSCSRGNRARAARPARFALSALVGQHRDDGLRPSPHRGPGASSRNRSPWRRSRSRSPPRARAWPRACWSCRSRRSPAPCRSCDLGQRGELRALHARHRCRRARRRCPRPRRARGDDGRRSARHTGCAIDTCATQPVPKNELSRA